MDIEAVLRAVRELYMKQLSISRLEPDEVMELAELMDALDGWLASGGFPPKAWARGPLGTRPRIMVDPNAAETPGNPGVVAVLLEEANPVPSVGEPVFAVQPDSDGTELVGLARVTRIDEEAGLLWLEVNWSGSWKVSP